LINQPDVFRLISHRDFGLAPILRVHSPDFVEYLQTAYKEWVAAGRTPQGVLPDSFPHPALVNHLPNQSWKASVNSSIEAKVSTYAFDLGTMIVDSELRCLLSFLRKYVLKRKIAIQVPGRQPLRLQTWP
jgi:acetoin utilization deacetylase AcuC-like enzyme